MEDLNSVVSGASSRGRAIANKSREPNRADVDSKFIGIISAPELTRFFSDAIGTPRIHDSLLGSLLGGVRAEGSDRTGPEHSGDLFSLGCLQAIV